MGFKNNFAKLEGKWYCEVARSNYETFHLDGDGRFSLYDRIVFSLERGRAISGTYTCSGEMLTFTSELGNVRRFRYAATDEGMILWPAADAAVWYTDGLYAMEPRAGERTYVRTPPSISSPNGYKPEVVLLGWSRIEITPRPEHFGTSAHLRVHDPLYATMVWVEEPGGHHAFVLPDLAGVGGPARDMIRAHIAARVGINPMTFVVGATHSHNAPMVTPAYGRSLGATRMPDVNDSYAEYLAHQIAQGALRAYEGRETVRFGFGRGTVSEVASSRRVYGAPFEFHSLCVGKDYGVGLVDPEVSVLLFEKVARPEEKLVLYSFACHPVGYGGDGNGYNTMSADVWGVASRQIEAFLAPAKVTAHGGVGAAGSSNPRMFIDSRDWSQIDALGKRMAEGVRAALNEMRPPEPLNAFRAGVDHVEMAARPPFSEEDHRERVAVYQSDPTLQNYYLADMTRAVRNGRVRSDVTAWVLNHRTAAVFYPDEVCVQFGLETKKYSPYEETVVFGYCDYQIYYVMVGGDQAQGGFELSFSNLAAGEGDKLLTAGLNLIRALAQGR